MEQRVGIELEVAALPGIPYEVWIYSRCDAESAQKNERLRHDTIALEVVNGRIVSRPETPAHRTFSEGPRLTSFSGSALVDGYVWLGGWSDRNLNNQEDPVVVQFDDNSSPKLRLIPYEGPLRIGEIRLIPQGGDRPQ